MGGSSSTTSISLLSLFLHTCPKISVAPGPIPGYPGDHLGAFKIPTSGIGELGSAIWVLRSIKT